LAKNVVAIGHRYDDVGPIPSGAQPGGKRTSTPNQVGGRLPPEHALSEIFARLQIQMG
jgi:hypothetical protein